MANPPTRAPGLRRAAWAVWYLVAWAAGLAIVVACAGFLAVLIGRVAEQHPGAFFATLLVLMAAMAIALLVTLVMAAWDAAGDRIHAE